VLVLRTASYCTENEWTPTSQPSVDVHRIQALSPDERRAIQETILRLNPMPKQEHSGLTSIMGDYDHTLDERYTKWECDKVPHFVRDYERKIELNYGQLKIRFRIENRGQVPAESLLIRLTATESSNSAIFNATI
jgi:hypothetical protein